MRKLLIIVLVIFGPTQAWAQADDDAVEAAKLGMIEKLYERNIASFRKHLDGRNMTEEEKESLLFDAIDAFSLCMVLAAKEQAHEQGLSEEIILKGVGGKTRGKEEWPAFLAIDVDALKEKRMPCNKALGDKLGFLTPAHHP